MSTINLRDISRFKRAAPGTILSFPSTARIARTVLLEVNSSAPACIMVAQATTQGDEGATGYKIGYVKGTERLLGTVDGYQSYSFSFHGPLAVMIDGDDDVFWYSPDGDRVAIQGGLGTSFVRPIERKTVNPELAMMQYLVRANQRANHEQQKRNDATLAALARGKPNEVVNGDAGGVARKVKAPVAGAEVKEVGETSEAARSDASVAGAVEDI